MSIEFEDGYFFVANFNNRVNHDRVSLTICYQGNQQEIDDMIVELLEYNIESLDANKLYGMIDFKRTNVMFDGTIHTKMVPSSQYVINPDVLTMESISFLGVFSHVMDFDWSRKVDAINNQLRQSENND